MIKTRKRKKKIQHMPKRYVSNFKGKKKREQIKEILKSKAFYKKGKYYTRKKFKSFKAKRSKHLKNAEKIYNISVIKPSFSLANATKCSINGLTKIFKKGVGAYYSSGSRPNQTGHSWAYARLASAITGGKASAVDMKILEHSCQKSSKALKLAKQNYKKYKKGTRRVKQVKV
tara:strand:+ start:894 stop:1412 length:519 start_codon:yes stop_codon:yes gene_type:complete